MKEYGWMWIGEVQFILNQKVVDEINCYYEWYCDKVMGYE